MKRRVRRIAVTVAVLIPLGILLYLAVGLWQFSNIGTKELVFSLMEKDSCYELYKVYQGALGSDCFQTVVDGTVYSNTIPRFDIAEARIGSIIIKDSIFICIMSEEDSIKLSIPMDR